MHLILVVSASSDTTLKIWGIEEGRCMSTLRTHRVNIKHFKITLGWNFRIM